MITGTFPQEIEFKFKIYWEIPGTQSLPDFTRAVNQIFQIYIIKLLNQNVTFYVLTF